MATTWAYMQNRPGSDYDRMQNTGPASPGLTNYSPGGVAGIQGQQNIANTIEAGRWNVQGIQEQGKLAQALEEARWKRMMGLFEGSTFQNMLQTGQGGGGGAAQVGDQFAATQGYPAVRNYDSEKRDIANRMGARGMSLSSVGDNARGQAYGNLSRSLAEAGTAGEIAQKKMNQDFQAQQQNFLAQMLQAMTGMARG